MTFRLVQLFPDIASTRETEEAEVAEQMKGNGV
jgi:hypothetical protein